VRTLASALESSTFSSRWEEAAHVRVLVVRGRLDAAGAPQLSAGICTSGRDAIVLDLREVQAIDIGALRDVLLAARVVGIRLHLVCLKAAPIHSVFDLALVGPVALHESPAEAVLAAILRP
jgi:anti-anti-sigma regulatory factor